MAGRTQRIASELGVNVMGRLNMLRFADASACLEAANENGEMLVAALDGDREDPDSGE